MDGWIIDRKNTKLQQIEREGEREIGGEREDDTLIMVSVVASQVV
jgi:hypothetical protein